MAFVPVPNVWEVELRYLYFNQNVENTLYFKASPGSPDASAATLATMVLLWWNAEIRPLLSSSLTLREIFVTDLSSADGEGYTLVPPIPLPVGGDTAAGLPGSVSMAVSFRTALRGRSFRGRNFMVGLVEPAVTGNEVSSDFSTNIQQGYNALLDTPYSDDFTWVVVSRFSGGAPRTTGVATDVNAAVVVDRNVDSQRRRLNGRGS